MTVDQIYDTVSDMARTTESGYISNDEFNRVVNLAQVNLFEYYTRDLESGHPIADSLSPFIKATNLTSVSTGVFSFPTDFRNDLRESKYGIIENNPVKGEEPITTWYDVRYMKMAQVNLTVSSPIRQGSDANRKYRYYYEDGNVKLSPEGLQGLFKLKYLRLPAAISRAVTLDVPNAVENYDAGSSVHPEWLDKDLDNLVDLVLLLLGITVRESALVAWVANKNSVIKPQTMNN